MARGAPLMTRPSLLYSTHVSVWPRRRRGSAFLARNLSAPYCSSSFFFWSSFSFSCSSSNRFFARIACHVVSWWGWDGGDEMPSGFQRNHYTMYAPPWGWPRRGCRCPGPAPRWQRPASGPGRWCRPCFCSLYSCRRDGEVSHTPSPAQSPAPRTPTHRKTLSPA